MKFPSTYVTRGCDFEVHVKDKMDRFFRGLGLSVDQAAAALAILRRKFNTEEGLWRLLEDAIEHLSEESVHRVRYFQSEKMERLIAVLREEGMDLVPFAKFEDDDPEYGMHSNGATIQVTADQHMFQQMVHENIHNEDNQDFIGVSLKESLPDVENNENTAVLDVVNHVTKHEPEPSDNLFDILLIPPSGSPNNETF